ncbi:MAG TPA: glycosyltransferase family 2 protein [Clostridiales bacterium]|nr:glycosyltransferase family 2 protein [Clostridiales bacterium]
MSVFSIIIPCYNEEAVLHETHKRLTQVMQGMGDTYELIYVNDGSRDKTPLLLDQLAQEDSHVRVVHFARNGGHQVAVSAGLDYATGEAIVIIDADLQDPPEVIPEMAEKWRQGAQVVYGKRRSRKDETGFKKWTAKVYYRLLRKLAGNAFPEDTGDFRLVDKQVADVVRRMPERNRYLRGMFVWVGFRQEAVLFDRDKRFAGETHYPLSKMLKLSANGIFGFSNKPLSFITWAGLALLALGGLGLCALIVLALLGFSGGLWWLAAWQTALTGILLLALGIVGAYIARIYDEAKGRPLYVVASTRGFPDSPKKTYS